MVKRRRTSTADSGGKETNSQGVKGSSSHGVNEEKKGKVGGVSIAPKTEGSIGLSVREKRARLASEAESAPSTKSKDGTEDPAPVQPTRTSGRVPKKPKRDMSPPPSPPKKLATTSIANNAKDGKSEDKTGTPEAKGRRQWECWSQEDILTFFEALHEHGRDFDAIHKVFSQKHSKRGDTSFIKTKDQIRHFYRRTWNKISKYITVEGDLNKYAFELYGLINYGEIRKRIGNKMDEKIGMKLNELIHKGSTSVKSKGKTHRLRTPVCRALKKLNNTEEPKDVDEIKMPDLVTVEMVPHTNAAWVKVQAMAQNPLLRVKLKPTKRLSDIIEFLTKKWKSHRLHLKENMHAEEESLQEINLILPSDVKLHPFELTPAPAQPRNDLTLETYKEMVKNSGDLTGHSPSTKRGGKGHASKGVTSNVESVDDCAQSAEDVQHKLLKSSTPGSLVDSSVNNNNVKSELVMSNNSNTIGAKEEVSKLTTSKPAGKSVSETQRSEEDSSSVVVVKDKLGAEHPKTVEGASGEGKPGGSKDENGESSSLGEKFKDYKKGWTLKTASEITIADLCLALGGPEKLTIEYEWVDKKPTPDILPMCHNLTNSLRRLVHLAVTEFSDFSKSRGPRSGHLAGRPLSPSPPSKCTCGAAQAGTPPGGRAIGRSPRVGNSPATPKNPKSGAAAVSKAQVNRKLEPNAIKEEMTSAQVASPGVSPITSTPDAVFRVPTALPIRPNSGVRISPNTLAERNLLQQINTVNRTREILLPRRNKKTSRCMRRPLVVQRTLLPKTHVQEQQIMAVAMLPNSQLAKTGSFMPLMPEQMLKEKPCMIPNSGTHSVGMVGQSPLAQQVAALAAKARRPQSIVARAAAATLGPAIISEAAKAAGIAEETSNEAIHVSGAQQVTVSRSIQGATQLTQSGSIPSHSVASSTVFTTINQSTAQKHLQLAMAKNSNVPIIGVDKAAVYTSSTPVRTVSAPNLSNLLDISLPAAPEVNESTDRLIDLALGNSISNMSSSFSGFLESGDKTTDGDPSLATPVVYTEMSMDGLGSTASLSPNKTIRISNGNMGDPQWIPTEEFSLSQFLTDSPVKKPDPTIAVSTAVPPPHILCEGSRDSTIMGRLDVDTTLQCMMNENSMDYVAKFADLAAQIAASAGTQQDQLRKPDRLAAE